MPINDKIPTIDGICGPNILDVVFIMPIIVKMPTIAGICEPDKSYDQLSMQTIIASRLACLHALYFRHLTESSITTT